MFSVSRFALRGLSLTTPTTRTSTQARRLAASAEKHWRPALADVERLSRGLSARTRGTGSRAVPHRLDKAERRAYDIALRKGYVELNGSGYRRERKGSPLRNIFRQWCDARKRHSVVLRKMSDGRDLVEVDLATLRGGSLQDWDVDEVVSALLEVATTCGAGVVGSAPEGVEYLQDPDADVVWCSGATWELPAVSLTFQCETRSQAKKVAAGLAEAWPIEHNKKLEGANSDAVPS